MQKTIQYSLQQQTERFIESIENLGFNIDTLKPYLGKDYSSILVDMLFALKEIGYGNSKEGCLDKIHHELKILNKTIIIAALLMCTPKDPERTLKQYNNIIEQYLK
ncbi:MAG: hypothetical protein IJL05_01095 [Alphaproteobacteria bacterium]|nr:hypothetical protein [Alphaproteobacteria bacterium]